MCYQLQLTPGTMYKIVYCAHHARIRIVLKMLHEIQRTAQDYEKVHPARGTAATKFVKIWEEMEKIGVPCNTWEPYYHKSEEYNDINYRKSYGSTSDKILIGHEGILKV